MKRKIIFAEKYGICSGVKNALNIVNQELAKNNSITYVFHEIVHNSFVINDLTKHGVIFTENLDEIPNNSSIIFSAHGVAKDIENQALAKNLNIIDGTCPLVKKNHHIAEEAEKRGDYIIFIGNKNHAEVIGTYGRVTNKDKFFVVETDDDIANLPSINAPVILLCQTTLSEFDVANKVKTLQQKFPQLINYGGICYATTSRQQSIITLTKQCDLILVIGSTKSSNSKQLATIANSMNCPAFLLETPTELHKINFDKVENIGISAGASTPQEQIDLILAELNNLLELEICK